VDNRAGVGGTLAAEIVARATPDGHTLMLAANALAANPALFQPAPFDPVRDLSPVSLVGRVPVVLAVRVRARPSAYTQTQHSNLNWSRRLALKY